MPKELFILKKQKRIKFFLQNNFLNVTGPLGNINYNASKLIKLYNNKFFIKNSHIDLVKHLFKKLIQSVTIGWYLELSLNGVGYKVFKWQNRLAFDLGYSVLLWYNPPAQVKIKTFKNKISCFSLNQDLLNKVCFTLQNYAFPDVYKGKGLLFKNQVIKLKKKAKT